MTTPTVLQAKNNMKKPSEAIENNRSGKPDVGDKRSVEATVLVLRTKRRTIESAMRSIMSRIRQSANVDLNAELEKYEELNKKLYAAKVSEAEFVYLRNIL